MLRQLSSSGAFEAVYGGSRSGAFPDVRGAIPFAFDLTDESSIAAASAEIGKGGPLDLVIVATGILHRSAEIQPEKSYRAIDPAVMAELFALNAIGPALIAKHMMPLLSRDRRSVFAALSARVGSISDNRLGGWHSYRASKAALNALIKTFAIELASRNRHAIAVALHPGTVDTGLSLPFQRGVRPGTLQTASASAAALLKVIAGLSPSDSGGFFAWDGQPIPY